jgi:hypothetical protein
MDDFELNEFKRQRILNKEFWTIVKEIISFSIFLIFLFVVAYSNLSFSSIFINQLYQNTFVNKQSNDATGLHNVIRLFLLNFLTI